MRDCVLEEGGEAMFGIMIQGTSSDVGKSFVCTALCRAFARKGIRVTPFKSQNMSNNSYVTKDGAEIGRSQGIQAEAAFAEASVMMSPILLKPRNDRTSEVIRFGKVHKTLSGKDYRDQFYEMGIETIKEALAALEKEFDVVVIEGAGSPVEMNLNDRELVNMKVAELADVPVILVADIDRGGIFASIAGTLQLLNGQERSRVIGVIINKFRGDQALFESGRKWIETNLHVPVLGVLPYVDHHRIESEDSLARQVRYRTNDKGMQGLDIAMIDLPYLTNDTDLEPFRHEGDVTIRLVGLHDEFGIPDAVILPGTQSILSDLKALQHSSLAKQIATYVKKGGTIIGISEGFYMLGEEVIKGEERVTGLGILPMLTTVKKNKNMTAMTGKLIPNELKLMDEVRGFGFDHGEVIWKASLSSFMNINGEEDGVFLDEGKIIGTSMHHLFYHDDLRTWWLNQLRQLRGLPKQQGEAFNEERLRAYDELANWLEDALDTDALLDEMKAWNKQHG